MTPRSSIFSFKTLRGSFLPGAAVWLALGLVLLAEVGVRRCTPNLGWYEGLSSLGQWVNRLHHELGTQRPAVWLMGNSVLAYGVDTDALKRGSGRDSVALPFGGATFAGDIAMMEYFLKRAPVPPEEVVFCTTKDDFNPNGERSWISTTYQEYDTWRGWTFDRLFRLGDSRSTLMNTVKSWVLGRDTAAARNPSEESFEGKIPPEKYEYMNRLMQDYALDEAAFGRLATVAARTGFRVRIVLMPVSRAYLDWHDAAHPELSCAEISTALARQCRRFGFAFRDASRMAPDALELYADPYHMTAIGRERFSQLLAADLAEDGATLAVPQEENNKMKIACIGDSITYGSGLDTRDTAAYPARLEDLSGGRFRVRNFGVPGTTLLRGSGRAWADTPACAAALEDGADAVVMMFGINDMAHPELLDSFTEDGVWLLERFRERNPAVRLYICTTTPLAPARLERENNRTIRETLIPALHAMADRTGAQLIPVHEVFPCTQKALPDGTHPSADGADLIARTVWNVLRLTAE